MSEQQQDLPRDDAVGPPPDMSGPGNGVGAWLRTLNREVPGLLALIMVVTYCVTVVAGIAVDEKFIWAISIILSFYFGSRRAG